MVIETIKGIKEDYHRISTLFTFGDEYRNKLEYWYRKELLSEINEGIVPRMEPINILSGHLVNNYKFDLIYSRFVLDKILEEESRKGLLAVIITIKKLLNSNSGIVINVVPTCTENGKQLEDINKLFLSSGFTLSEKPTKEANLGGNELPGTNPKGYIYKITN
jgi:hypothetical protein